MIIIHVNNKTVVLNRVGKWIRNLPQEEINLDFCLEIQL